MTPSVINAILLTIKTLVLVGLGLYGIFAAIIVRQEQLMATVLEESFEPVLRTLVIVHFAASVGLFLLALFLL
ncbi:MAG: hypothetical protein UU34_C0015G0016 [Candidatus Curtissbacteria bacterium GW2011_GWA1_41_11]|uniref:Uncharacterized protein n=1 Tax=Candidatus Curtissbacteria bacterium GW2011_GWA1_41_11 TaxID=1618409 RepID=A0A0G0UG50_9BACT|nr:MAG: hypothetical protein UU34_C0015G0016 [Candidatus Curtissbacteria bacterium GW2011_GWA1_41_11]